MAGRRRSGNRRAAGRRARVVVAEAQFSCSGNSKYGLRKGLLGFDLPSVRVCLLTFVPRRYAAAKPAGAAGARRRYQVEDAEDLIVGCTDLCR